MKKFVLLFGIFLFNNLFAATISDHVLAGGIGGNEKIGELIYDGGVGHLPPVQVTKIGNKCRLENDDFVVKNAAKHEKVVSGKCIANGEHNNILWMSLDDKFNGGFSPGLDALYGAVSVKKLFQEWYGLPVVTEEDHKTPMKVNILINIADMPQAWFSFSEKALVLGGGDKEYYNFAVLDTVAHEFGHVFTCQHSLPGGEKQSEQIGALQESFADMTAAALEFYLTGSNSWKIGYAFTKGEGAMRYMDDPQKDGESIDHMRDINSKTRNNYNLSGIFSKAFYLLATSNGWNTKKAFDVMVKANMKYWSPTMETFQDAACGVLSAAKEYGYNEKSVIGSFYKVGIDTTHCGTPQRFFHPLDEVITYESAAKRCFQCWRRNRMSGNERMRYYTLN